jgi:UDP-N-acetylmuramoyl-tripeptide--D-alanyl-D-alanine ligase
MQQAAQITVAPDDVEIRWRDDGFRCHFLLRTPVGECPIDMALGGRHNVLNAMAAVGAALALGAGLRDVAAGLAGLRPVRGRLQTRKGRAGLRLIDDTYNANPDSVAAAIALLARAPGARWLVLGDLAELGPRAAELHARIGRDARDAGIDRLYTVGSLSAAASDGFGTGACHFATQAALLDALRADIPGPVWALVKGSRASAMERVVAGLLDEGVA